MTRKKKQTIFFFMILYLIALIDCIAESNWNTTPPNAIYITKTQYRYRTKEFQDGNSSTMAGWTLDHSTPGGWGAWISNGQTAIQAETDREVRTVDHPAVTEITGYSYWRYEYLNTSDGKTYYTFGRGYADSCGYSVTRRDLTTTVAERLPLYNVYEGNQSYGRKYNFWFYETPIYSVVTPAYTEYQYRTRTRTYTFYRWLSWSAWQDEPVTGDTNKQVETRVLYAPDETVLRSSIRVGVDQEVPMLPNTGMQLLFENNGVNLNWISSNPQIASVSQRGYVSAHTEGTTTITVTHGGTTAAIRVIVKAWQRLTMPTQLTAIEDSAFEDDSFELADLRNGLVRSIGKNAFANNPRLRMLIVGNKLTDLAESVVSGSDHAVLVCPSNQVAVNCVQGHNIPYYVLGKADTYIKVSSISVRPEAGTITPKGTLALTAEVQPSNATQPGVNWRSNNTSVATVSATGEVTGVAVGTAVITATAKDNSSVSASCTVTVQPIQVQSIILNQPSLSLVKGSTASLTATVQPADASNPAVIWSSSNPAAATVSQTGVVTAIAPGTSIITARAADGSGVEAACTVTVLSDVVVNDGNFTSVYANNITQTDATVRFRINLSGVPTSGGFYFGTTSSNLALIKSETYSSTVTEVFFNLNKYGKTLTANTTYYYQMYYVYQGTTYKTAVHSFTTLPNVTITPTSGSVEVGQNETVQLSVAVTPAEATVTWASSDASIATVSSSGVVTGTKGGTVTITATAQYVNSTGTASFAVSVNPIKYHVVIIGNYNYKKNTLEIPILDWFINDSPSPAMKNDTECLAQAMRVNAHNNDQIPDVHYYMDINKSSALSNIRSGFAVADYNDINILFLGGKHGGSNGSNFRLYNDELISPSELRSTLNGTKGTTIVIIAACHSGYFTNCCDGLSGGNVYIMTSCRADQKTPLKYQNENHIGFCYYLLLGLGWDDPSQTETELLHADCAGNQDNAVTLDELFNFVNYRVSDEADLQGGEQNITRSWSAGQGNIVIYRRPTN